MLPRTAATLSISWCTTRRRPGHWSNAFAYDHAGNRTGLTYFDGTSTHSYTYDYNTLNQLTSRTSGNFVRSYLYDANGNRTRQQDVVSSTVMGTWEYDWNEDDRLVAFRVKNGQGNVTKTVRYEYCRTCGGQRTGRVEYDENDEIVEWLRYEMDGLNHLRIDEVYDADSNGELEDPSATGDTWRVQRVYINGPGQLGQIAKVIVFTYASATSNTVASEDVYYYHYDILGNVSVISDPAGDEADQFEQAAFGNLVSGAWTTRIGGITEQITTKPYDADLGLYYFNARWYDPVVGQFINRSAHSLLSADRFCGQDPVNFVDVSGLNKVPSGVANPLKPTSEEEKWRRCACKALYAWAQETWTGTLSNLLIGTRFIASCGIAYIPALLEPYVDSSRFCADWRQWGSMKGCDQSATECTKLIKDCGIPGTCTVEDYRIPLHWNLKITCTYSNGTAVREWIIDPWMMESPDQLRLTGFCKESDFTDILDTITTGLDALGRALDVCPAVIPDPFSG